MIGLKLKVLRIWSVGCAWATLFEMTDEVGVQPILPQHFIIYTESKPNLNEGQPTSIHLFEQHDFGRKKVVENPE